MSYELSSATQIGHVHLKVSNLERSIKFYSDVLGFKVTQRYGNSAAFLAAGKYHHHIGLNTWDSKDASPASKNATGLYHFAILYPSRRDLALAFKHLLDCDIAIEGTADHGVSEAIYFSDPDQNGIELYWDKPQTEWPVRANGDLAMTTDALDLNKLLEII